MFGDGAVEDTVDGRPGVSYGERGVVCVFHEVAAELLGVLSWATSGLQDERGKVDVWISVKFDLLCSLDHVAWAFAGCCNEGPDAGKRRDNGDIKVRGVAVLTF